MHELSIALSILEGVEEELSRRPETQVIAVHLKLGALSGVVKEALLFSYDVACEGTPLQGSKLVIEAIPVELYCAACAQECPAVSIQNLSCAVCGQPSEQVVRGTELEVVALELAEEHAAPVG